MPSKDAWSAQGYAAHARFVSDLGSPVLDLLAPMPGERILDLGCGDGALTARLRDAGAVVTGVDGSADMVAAAQARGLDARVMDGHSLIFDGGFDAVFSNAALHWMTEPRAVILGVWNALKPGGRFVGEFGGMGNVAAIRTALIAALSEAGQTADLKDIWYFPTPDEYATLLAERGFRVESAELIPRPTPVASGMRAWLETLAAPVLGKVPGDREAFLDRVTELAAPALRDGAGNWTADYVRLRFSCVKP
ncbi:methyltransferase domain-containing protein [Pontivivens ytuae]|uniref:Methyltransferase domain-containing protein n=1 Tax=Pontivivens ytuae TaxID=2789856 RepID=A0A7S9LQ64_9RHOB|nr:methyltransferase domain-containing protein [Pontivivens ytuae]QPH53259.1 methyltransferase domain-containing protein [Pontivivens ytuae]